MRGRLERVKLGLLCWLFVFKSIFRKEFIGCINNFRVVLVVFRTNIFFFLILKWKKEKRKSEGFINLFGTGGGD